MLQLMRDKAKSWATVIIVAVIAFMMAITGLERLSPQSKSEASIAAVVNGDNIPESTVVRTLEQQRQYLLQQEKKTGKQTEINEAQLRSEIITSLIERKLQEQDVLKNGMTIDHNTIDNLIVSMPEFQVNGVFNQDRFKLLLNNLQLSPLQFSAILKYDMMLVQFRRGLVDSNFILPSEINRIIDLENQRRDGAWFILKGSMIKNKAEIIPSKTAIKKYYHDNKPLFRQPEAVQVNYITLNKKELTQHITVTEEEIKESYEQRVAQIKALMHKKRRVSTILIEVNNNQRTEKQAKILANSIWNKLKKGESFSQLAQKYSNDTGSAKKGGDIGFVEPGFYGNAFDNALALLSIGEISPVIKTDYGFQIIKYTQQDSEKIPSALTLRKEIITTLKNKMASDLILKKSKALADISYEAADLTEPAKQLNLKIQTSTLFTRAGGTGIASNKKVVKAAFSDDVLKLGANSDVIMLSPDVLAVIHLIKHNKTYLQSLSHVRKQIVTLLKAQKETLLLKQQADKIIASLSNGAPNQFQPLQWINHKNLSRLDTNKNVNKMILNTLFKMPHPDKDKPVYLKLVLSNGNVAVIKLTKVYLDVKEIAKQTANIAPLSHYLAQLGGRIHFLEYVNTLHNLAKITINKPENSN